MIQEDKLKEAKRLYQTANADQKYVLERLFPELTESEDEKIRKALISFLKSPFVNEYITDEKVNPWVIWLEKHGEQKPVEWSKEDESMIGRIRSIIEKYAFSQSAVDVNGELCEKEFIDADNWLKSLKERVQPRQEWSEEDDDDAWLNDIISKAECNLQLNKGEINWLKSLKARYTWKPSDEQMGALLYYTSQSPILSSLYNDLKAIFKV